MAADTWHRRAFLAQRPKDFDGLLQSINGNTFEDQVQLLRVHSATSEYSAEQVFQILEQFEDNERVGALTEIVANVLPMTCSECVLILDLAKDEKDKLAMLNLIADSLMDASVADCRCLIKNLFANNALRESAREILLRTAGRYHVGLVGSYEYQLPATNVPCAVTEGPIVRLDVPKETELLQRQRNA